MFTRLVATVIDFLCLQGTFYYLDDWFFMASSKTLLESLLQMTLVITQDLGFLFN